MGQSTDGQICFGIKLEEEIDFPWDGEEYEGEFEEWYLYEVLGYKNPFEVFDRNGNYLPGFTRDSEMVDEYFEALRKFKEENSIPFQLVNYCSGEYPMYILAVKATVIKAYRGHPQDFLPNRLALTSAERDLLLRFCITHDLVMMSDPQWWLSSYWG